MNVHVKLRVGLICALILLFSFSFAFRRRLAQTAERRTIVLRAYDVLLALASVADAVHQAESSQREFLLSQGQTTETDFDRNRAAVLTRLARLRSLIDDAPHHPRPSDPQLDDQLDRLSELIEQTLSTEAEHIASARLNLPEAALEYARTAALDTQRMQRINTYFRELQLRQEDILQQSRRVGHESQSFEITLIYVRTVLGAIFLTLGVLWVSRTLRQREQVELTLHHVLQGLEARVQERTADLSKTTASLEAEIAERRHTESQLRDSEQRYRLLFENSPLPMEVFDPETLAFLAVNTASLELYGYTAEEFLHMTLLDLRPPAGVAPFLQYLATVKDSSAYNATFLTRHKNGRLITVEARVRNIEFGGRSARLKLLTDVTEKKRLEDQLQQLQKMEAVGRLAGGIAHDFNNLLMVILGYSDSILQKLRDSDPIRVKLSEIHAAAQRAANLTSQLLAFSRKQMLQMQPVQLNLVVSNINQMIRRLLGEDIEITLDLQQDLGQVLGDPTQLEQVVVNLAVNARDAMPHGGKLTIETRNIILDEPAAAAECVPPGKYALLSVNDCGSGMDEAVRKKIFEPFFTTKEVGKGTGLGLSMVLGVVQQSGGCVTVESELGLGTTFKVYLPQLTKPLPAPVPPPQVNQPSPAVRVGGTILLVEDEKQLRTLSSEVLQDAGFFVVEASSGQDALQLAATLSAPPSLLLTDVVMPQMSGLQLAEELRRKWPELPVIYTSGYTDHVLLGGSGLDRDVAFLQKPYLPGALLEHVAQAIQAQHKHESSPVVLVVDDDEDIRQQVRLSLRQTGCRVIEAPNGLAALTQLSTHSVKLVITDLFMPEKDGLELIGELKRSYPAIKILALSGSAGGGFLKVATSLGADVVLRKPFLSEQITQVAEALLA